MSLPDVVHQLVAAGRETEALALVTKAAAEGEPEALFLSGLWRLIGSPCPRDLPAARHWLARAMEHGHIDAGRMLIALTANGTGGPADRASAFDLLKRLAAFDPESAEQLTILSNRATSKTISALNTASALRAASSRPLAEPPACTISGV